MGRGADRYEDYEDRVRSRPNPRGTRPRTKDPVSYTHLDVYKRQEYSWSRKGIASASNRAARWAGVSAATSISSGLGLSLIHI